MNPNIAFIINYICGGNFNYENCARFPSQEDIDKSNIIREEFKQRLLIGGFNVGDFYVPVGNPSRADNDTLFYKLSFGVEARIVGTGLFELAFRTVFTHSLFEKIISYIYPPIAGRPPRNFDPPNTLLEFCNGIFRYPIPQFTQVLPIRLASYFYPEHFLPIFKLNELQKLSRLCGDNRPELNATAKGARLFKYNSFLLAKMVALPVDNYIKSHIAYLTFYTVDLYNRLCAGEQFPAIYQNYPTQWEKDFITCGQGILEHLDLP